MNTQDYLNFLTEANKSLLNEHIPLNDMEGEMAMEQLKGIIEYATKALEMMKPETQLEAWVQSKIAVAKESMDAVADHLSRNPDALENAKEEGKESEDSNEQPEGY